MGAAGEEGHVRHSAENQPNKKAIPEHQKQAIEDLDSRYRGKVVRMKKGA